MSYELCSCGVHRPALLAMYMKINVLWLIMLPVRGGDQPDGADGGLTSGRSKRAAAATTQPRPSRAAAQQPPRPILRRVHHTSSSGTVTALLSCNDLANNVFLTMKEQREAETQFLYHILFQVVDTNVTSLVTPRLTRALKCHDHQPQTCRPSSCLNGGRCVGPNTEKK